MRPCQAYLSMARGSDPHEHLVLSSGPRITGVNSKLNLALSAHSGGRPSSSQVVFWMAYISLRLCCIADIDPSLALQRVDLRALHRSMLYRVAPTLQCPITSANCPPIGVARTSIRLFLGSWCALMIARSLRLLALLYANSIFIRIPPIYALSVCSFLQPHPTIIYIINNQRAQGFSINLKVYRQHLASLAFRP